MTVNVFLAILIVPAALLLLVCLIDAYVSRSVSRHVAAALDMTPQEQAYEAHVAAALAVTRVPAPRRPQKGSGVRG